MAATVGELIDKLREYDRDLPVVIAAVGSDLGEYEPDLQYTETNDDDPLQKVLIISTDPYE